MMAFAEKEWVQKAKQGDKAAFGKLVNQYYEMVYAVTFGVLRNREAARDVTQDIFLKVFRDLFKFDGKSKFKTWLYRVAMNGAIDAHRKKKPTQYIDVTDASEEEGKAPLIIEEHRAGPRDVAHREELKVRMKEALEKLSSEHRAVLVLREWDGMSYDEIAETLGVELGTVMSRLHYARQKLKEIFKKEWEAQKK